MMKNPRRPAEGAGPVNVQTSRFSPPISGQIFSPALLKDIRGLIEGARRRAAAAVNSEMVTLYWSIGERIRKDTLASERASYGEQIVDALSRRLSEEYGRGFSRPNLFHMIHFAETFPGSRNCLRTE